MMTDNCKLVFEVENLNNASPATVSRCGQVYVSPSDLDYRNVVKGWIAYRKELKGVEEETRLTNVFQKYLFSDKNNVIDKLSKIIIAPKMSLSNVIQATNICNVVTGVLKQFEDAGKTPSDSEMEIIVIFGLIWGIGGVYELEDRKKF